MRIGSIPHCWNSMAPIFEAGTTRPYSLMWGAVAMSVSTHTAAGQEPTHALIERDVELRKLEQCLERVSTSGTGVVAFVGGEAGVGKTSLLRAFCARREPGSRVLQGACEPLLAPRPFGPFIDLAESIGGELSELIDDEARPHTVASALLRALDRDGTPSLVVLEDLHWADEATLDV